MNYIRKKSAAFAGLSVAAVVLAGCGPDASTPAEEVPHGYVEGAEEAAEAQSRLVVADAQSGTVRVLDLITGDAAEAGQVHGVEEVVGDGRFAYLAAGPSVRIVDSGSWMVDHGDHVHYYRAAVREVGTIPGTGPVRAYRDPAVVAVSFGDGTASLLDRAELEAGTIAETGKIEDVARGAAVLPFDGHVLVPVEQPGRAGALQVRSRDGRPVTTIDQPCPGPAGAAVTRRGAVFGCADGALLVDSKDGRFSGEKIPYPRPVSEDERAQEFDHRPGSDTLAAKAGATGVWSLDVAHRKWTHIATGPVLTANAVGAGGPVLALTADGALRAFDGETGQETAVVPLLSDPVAGGVAPTIEIDTSRAYINDATAGVVHEIDYNDALRRARTLELGGRVTHLVETGR
ncbi:hypothetical protein SAMN05216215_103824 [Saccharopolyspora shandongensis]|uniref:ABC transporter n=1 Tax=Saccharopolyspora shandongensis TaxID=418495 RepID=A0A1H3NKM1_9PSEU|nr:hypothetical protein [Saccharopolyspora shandongensis]SDY88985.1 hypothetical protein SAMN05216215_103824 [Saccharopolyspora shandongensis]